MCTEDYKKWTVYKHTTPSNKVYIGITSQEPEKRWLSGHGYRNTYFAKAIKKYGWENIKHEIIFSQLDEVEAKEKEVELIELYQSYDRQYGYNCTRGGDGTAGLIRSKEQIQNLKNLLSKTVYQRKLDGTLIKKWNGIREIERQTGFHRHNITACCNKKCFQSHGYLWSFDEYYIAKKPKRKNCKTVYQYDLNGKFIKRWNSLADIEKELGYHKNNISHCCLSTSSSAYGYIWKYEKKNNIKYENKNIKKIKKVYQLTKSMQLIKIWDSLGDIEKELGHSKSVIQQCCVCKLKTAYGFIWRYECTLHNNISLISSQAKKVIQMDKQYNVIDVFDSMSIAHQVTRVNNISNCCNGKYKTAGGYVWVYEDDFEEFDQNIHRSTITHVKEVNKYDLNMNFLEEYKSVTEAAKSVGGATGNISLCCKGKRRTAYGYIWKYKYYNV